MKPCRLPKEADGIDAYKWNNGSTAIAFTKTNPDNKIEKETHERYGGFYTEDEGFKQNSLWMIPFQYDSISQAGSLPCYDQKTDSSKSSQPNPCNVFPKPIKLIGKEFYITDFAWAPNDKTIAFQFQPDNRVKSAAYADISLLN